MRTLLTSMMLMAAFLSGSFVSAQETVSEYRYYVPLLGTKDVALVNWQFALTAASDNSAFQAYVIQYDPFGNELKRDHFGVGEHDLLAWYSFIHGGSRRLRSLEVVSTQPLSGQLWAWNDFGDLNAVAMNQDRDVTNTLVIPFVPAELSDASISFSLMGISPTGQGSAIYFDSVDEDGAEIPAFNVRDSVASKGYVISTPGVTLNPGGLGDDQALAWGLVYGLESDFRLSGVQVYSSKIPAEKTAAFSVSGKGSEQGHIVLDSDRQHLFKRSLRMTNPNDEAVQVDLTLFYLVPAVPEMELAASWVQETRTVSLAPRAIQTIVLGELFEGVPGNWIRLAYQASRLQGEVPVATEIFVVDQIEDVELQRLGAGSPVVPSTKLSAWIPVNSNFTGSLQLATLGDFLPEGDAGDEDPVYVPEMTTLRVSLSFNGLPLSRIELPLKAGAVNTLFNSEKLAETLGLDAVGFVRVDLEVIAGPPVLAKETIFWGSDMALVEPAVFAVPEPVVDESPADDEENVGDEDAGAGDGSGGAGSDLGR